MPIQLAVGGAGDENLADEADYERVINAYRQADRDENIPSRKILDVRETPALCIFDTSWLSPDHVRFKEAERVMQCPNNTVSLACYNMSIMLRSELFINRAGGSRTGAEAWCYARPPPAFIRSAWKLRWGAAGDTIARAEIRALERVAALGLEWPFATLTINNAHKAILAQATGDDPFKNLVKKVTSNSTKPWYSWSST
ncbi:uncharacterized protein RCC_02544 [Ramularia collo-cygni]|uniref:Uncharacterized protein n=1 Tax=Ramularia collo-cygni TaxID=112498 RepID=A0A2D3V5F0_9PEZI|nr:uncharacterized protein RCC_02544 [Ramularia collo-cygni]CZT16709.1 uncharacterized protein RCC_02544 [Ramularia collo-cygni]